MSKVSIANYLSDALPDGEYIGTIKNVTHELSRKKGTPTVMFEIKLDEPTQTIYVRRYPVSDMAFKILCRELHKLGFDGEIEREDIEAMADFLDGELSGTEVRIGVKVTDDGMYNEYAFKGLGGGGV